jgi:hypothetical protein
METTPFSFRQRLVDDTLSIFSSWETRVYVIEDVAAWLPIDFLIRQLHWHWKPEWRRLAKHRGIDGKRLYAELRALGCEPTEQRWAGKMHTGFSRVDLANVASRLAYRGGAK